LFRLAFPDLHVTVEELNTDDETVTVRWTTRTRAIDEAEGNSITAKPATSTLGESRTFATSSINSMV
jgi:hypothetical protein